MGSFQELVGAASARAPALPAWFERLASIGIVSDDSEIARHQRFANIFTFASAGNIITQTATLLVYDRSGLAPIIVVNVVLFAAMLALPLLHRFGADLAAHLLVALSAVTILLNLFVFGRESQIYVYFSLVGVILFMFGPENPRSYLPWFVIMFLGLLTSLLFVPRDAWLPAVDPTLRRIVSSHAMINVAIVNALVIYFVLSSLRRTEIALADQFDRTAALVATVLPASVVERLTETPSQRIADRIDGLSVLFADLAGFTTAARPLPPEDIVDYLDELVRAFDSLCVDCGAEKIKTIGDSYMAVGGLDGDRRTGATAVGRLALAMLAAPQLRRTLGDAALSLRIGIHLGSATAGIIGDTRFTYDVWGDAVNVASRMESHGVPGRIHVSVAYRDAADGAFGFVERGEIEICGVGKTRTYFLEGAAPAIAKTGTT